MAQKYLGKSFSGGNILWAKKKNWGEKFTGRIVLKDIDLLFIKKNVLFILYGGKKPPHMHYMQITPLFYKCLHEQQTQPCLLQAKVYTIHIN